MLIKPDSTTAANPSAVPPAATACGNCGTEERRLLHHVRLRGVFRRLCTSCVLRLHPESFCPTCFQVYPPPPSRDSAFSCSKCHSSSHFRCAAATGITPSPNSYICPLCINPSTPIFKLKIENEANGDQKCRVMDRDAAKMLLAAATIAVLSMNKAVVLAKQEAEKRAREAALAQRRAKEALEHVAYIMMKDKLRKTELAGDVAGSGFHGGVGVGQLKRENNLMADSNIRNGLAAGGIAAMVLDEKMNIGGNVDRVENSNQVLAALNAVELRENETGGITARSREQGIHLNSDRLQMMDLDDSCRIRTRISENVGGAIAQRTNGGSDRVVFGRGPAKRDEEEDVDDDDDVVVFDPPTNKMP